MKPKKDIAVVILNWNGQRLLEEFLPFVEYMYVTPIIRPWSEFTRLVHPSLQNVIFGEQTAEEAMTEIAPEVNELLADQ